MAIPQPAARQDVRRAAVCRGDRPAACRACRRGPASRSEQALLSAQAWHPEPAMAFPQPAVRQDDRRAAVCRGDQLAACRAPASRSVQAWRSGQPRRGGLQAPPARETALPKVPAPDVPRAAVRLPLVASEQDARPAELPREAASVCAAARRGAASAHAAEAPLPEAATAASERQAAVSAPDASRAAEVAVSDVTARQPAAARRADAEVQPRAAARSGVPELQAVPRPEEVARPDAQRAAVPSALPWALPSKGASICRSLVVAALARPRAAARFAHAMRSLQIASRSEPSLQAARNEGWSWC